MTRTQVQLPDELHRRAKAFAAERELSLAEVARRGIEMFLDRYPEIGGTAGEWSLPKVRGGGMKVTLEKVHEIAAEEEEGRSLKGR